MQFFSKFVGWMAIVMLLAQPIRVLADGIGRIKNLTGEVHIQRTEEKLQAVVGNVVYQSDIIVTGKNSSVGLSFLDNSMLSVGSDSRLSLDQFSFDTTTHEGDFDVSLNKGTLSVIAGKLTQQNPNALKIKTPASILAVRGTELVVKVYED